MLPLPQAGAEVSLFSDRGVSGRAPYLALAGGTIPFMRRYSTICP